MGFLDTALGGMALGPISAVSSLMGMGGGGSSAWNMAALGPMAFGTAGSLFSSLMNMEMARQQMSWQEEMANTAHQREVRDLLAAGLNPILSVNAGAVTPNYQRAEIDNPMDSMFRGMSTAAQVGKFQSELDLLGSQADAAEAAVQSNYSAALKSQADAAVSQEEALNLQEERRGIRLDNASKAARLPGLNIERDIDESKLGEVTRRLNRVLETVGSGASSARDVGLSAPKNVIHRRGR